MNKPKNIIQGILAIGVMLVGIHMICHYDWLTPPSISGIGFLMAGLAMWIPHCPLMRMIFGGKGKGCGDCKKCSSCPKE